jgi:hypothetical protein
MCGIKDALSNILLLTSHQAYVLLTDGGTPYNTGIFCHSLTPAHQVSTTLDQSHKSNVLSGHVLNLNRNL